MPGLWKHPDGSVSRIAVPYDGTQTAATVRQADGTDVPVIDFHTRVGERDQTKLSNGIEILALDITAASPWSFNANTGVVNGRRNYVAPGGPVNNPALGWSGDTLNGGSKALVTSNGSFIQVANVQANEGVATKTFSVSRGKKYVFTVVLQNGSTPGTSMKLLLGTNKLGSQYADLSLAAGVVLPQTFTFTLTATSSSLYVAMGNQGDNAANVSLWSVPTLVKG